MLSLLSRSIVARLAAYYGALAAIYLAGWLWLPQHVLDFIYELHVAWIRILPTGDFVEGFFGGNPAAPLGVAGGAVLATVASITGFILALPVAWVYMYTRRKKGYTQSVVHSLILLPVLVAAVVVLVKNSLALAFALAGIVAAVRFRNTLEDSKDAVYIFLATVLGLAAGAQPGVAVALSVLFNIVVLSLWYTDFARNPVGLEDERARRQMKKALDIANRTSMFVARLDSEILEAMDPAQLDALAERVRRRRAEAGEGEVKGEQSREGSLRVTMQQTGDARAVVEQAFGPLVKRWSIQRIERGEPGKETVIYWLRLRKGAVPSQVMAAVQLAARDLVDLVEFSEREGGGG
jgi:hypothetical protein